MPIRCLPEGQSTDCSHAEYGKRGSGSCATLLYPAPAHQDSCIHVIFKALFISARVVAHRHLVARALQVTDDAFTERHIAVEPPHFIIVDVCNPAIRRASVFVCAPRCLSKYKIGRPISDSLDGIQRPSECRQCSKSECGGAVANLISCTPS